MYICMYVCAYIDMMSGGSNKSQHDIYLNKMPLFSSLCRLPKTTHPHLYKRYTYVYVQRIYVCMLFIFCFLYSGTIAQIMCSVGFVHKIDSNDWAQKSFNLSPISFQSHHLQHNQFSNCDRLKGADCVRLGAWNRFKRGHWIAEI